LSQPNKNPAIIRITVLNPRIILKESIPFLSEIKILIKSVPPLVPPLRRQILIATPFIIPPKITNSNINVIPLGRKISRGHSRSPSKTSDNSVLPGKSENWLMVNFSDNCHLYFRGENDTSICIVEVKLYGKSNASNYDALTGKISEIINKYLNISEDKIYVEYEETPFWGWSGSNF
jgi:hypothetical protein